MAPVYDDAKNCSTPMAGAEIEYAGFKVNVYPNMLFQVGKALSPWKYAKTCGLRYHLHLIMRLREPTSSSIFPPAMKS